MVNRFFGITWAIAVLMVMGATAHYLRNTVNNAFFLRSAGVSQKARSNLQEALDRQTQNLGQFAKEMGQTATLEETSFQVTAVRLLRDAPLFSTVAYLNKNFDRKWVFPFSAGRQAQEKKLFTPSEARTTAKRSITTGQPASSGLINLFDGGQGILLYAPIFRGTLWQGLAEGSVQVARVALDLIDPAVGRNFRYSIIDEQQGREIYSSRSSEDKTISPTYDAYFTLPVADRTWWVLLHPHSPPPTLAIVVGTLTAEGFLGILIFYLWRRRR